MNPKTSKIRAPRERKKKEGMEKGEWGSKDRLGRVGMKPLLIIQYVKVESRK
jgi:hypothetical protein